MTHIGVIGSRVIDTRLTIESQTACDRAVKARQTLITAREILRKSGSSAVERDALTEHAAAISKAISVWYKHAPCERHYIRKCKVCAGAK